MNFTPICSNETAPIVTMKENKVITSQPIGLIFIVKDCVTKP